MAADEDREPIPAGEVSGTEREENAIENGRPAVEAGRNTDEAEEQVGRGEIFAEAGNGSTEPGVETDQNTTQDTALQEKDSNNEAQRKRRQLLLQPRAPSHGRQL
ncbi:hypothetical protein DPMN_068954 [Dreissena polymorpha]|uniref:Uncharacterized protein n=1 Tax=Dreissena polymorpha TaxID=45954 RepID=A0A9D3Z2J9_DREPO|nr:hypothetical protein DPMN_068954 [Dreissena polymorpha]